MARYITRRETKRVFDKCINDISEGRYKSAVQRYDSIAGILLERASSPHASRSYNFGSHYLVTGFGKGIAEGLMEKGEQQETRDISDVAKEAKNFYDTFKGIKNASYRSVSGFEIYRALGRSYVSLGLEKEAIQELERLKEPRLMDIVKLSVKAEEL